MGFWEFVDSHKTKIVGGITAAFGFVQMNSAMLQQLVSPRAFGWVMFFVGLSMTAIGVTNTVRANLEEKKSDEKKP